MNENSREEKGIIFKNPFLEQFTRAKVGLAALVYISYWTILVILHIKSTNIDIKVSLGIYFFALLFWSLFEYLAHRFLFHFVTENALVKRIHFLIHGVHHAFPRDTERLVMPPLPGTAIVLFLLGIYYLFLGDLAFIFTAGFINGWAIYVSIHYMVHAFKPIKGLKILWTHHAKHHYKDGNSAYGVSSPFWDKVFGTMPK
jgi:4-hydroxysphinganine ceramide fatty acyl 2-hydroxylase